MLNLEQKVLSVPALYRSYFLKRNRLEYYDRMMEVRRTGNYEQWIKFFLQAFVESAEDAIATIDELKEVPVKLELSSSAWTALETLNTTVSDLRGFAKYFKEVFSDKYICVVGNANKIDENSLNLIDKFYYNYIHWKHKHERDIIEYKEQLDKHYIFEGKKYKYTLPQAMEEISRLEKETKKWRDEAENLRKLAQEEIRIQRRFQKKNKRKMSIVENTQKIIKNLYKLGGAK